MVTDHHVETVEEKIEYIHMYDIQPVPVYGETQTIKKWTPEMQTEDFKEVS